MPTTPKTKLSAKEMRLIRVLRDEALFVSGPQLEMLLEMNKRRANERLLKLVGERILRKRVRLDTYNNFRSPIYYLGIEGCKMIGMSKKDMEKYMTRIKNYSDRAIGHLLEVYDVFIKFTLESKVTEWVWHEDDKWFSIELGLYPDGFVKFEKDGTKYSAFIEVDRDTEGLRVLRGKFDKYRHFHQSGAFKKLFGQCIFRVLVITTSEERIEGMEEQNPAGDIWFATKQDFMRNSLWTKHWFAKEDFYSLDFSPFPEAPEPPQPSPEDPEAASLREQERLRWRQEEEGAKALGHKINDRLAWGSLYGFFGLWGFSVAMLRPVVSLILLLVVLYVVIFSDP